MITVTSTLFEGDYTENISMQPSQVLIQNIIDDKELTGEISDYVLKNVTYDFDYSEGEIVHAGLEIVLNEAVIEPEEE